MQARFRKIPLASLGDAVHQKNRLSVAYFIPPCFGKGGYATGENNENSDHLSKKTMGETSENQSKLVATVIVTKHMDGHMSVMSLLSNNWV